MVSTPGTIFYYYEDQRKTFQALQAIRRSAEHRTSPGYRTCIPQRMALSGIVMGRE
jgi:hypothetical protein